MRPRIILEPSQIAAALTTLPGWTLEAGMLTRTFTFPTFQQAIDFVVHVAQLAEAADHHPDIDIRYTRVRLALISHDAAGITLRDTSLASAISNLP